MKVRNRNGYYHLGVITGAEKLGKWLIAITKRAQADTVPARYEILENEADVMVMGRGIFEDYSKAIDSALKITKGFLIGGVLLFTSSLFL